MGDTPRGHMLLTAPDCMRLGAPGTNPYNLGTHSECHQQSPLVDLGR